MTTTIRNSNLLRQVANIIESHPERYNQRAWGTVAVGADDGLQRFDVSVGTLAAARSLAAKNVGGACGTAHCIAGHAAAASGYGPAVVDWYVTNDDYVVTWSEVSKLGSDPASTEGVAADLLGLTDTEAAILFEAGWKPRDGMSVPTALRRLAQGWGIEKVSAYVNRYAMADLDEDRSRAVRTRRR